MTEMNVRMSCLSLLTTILASSAVMGAVPPQRDRDLPTELVVRYHDHVPVQQLHTHALDAGVRLLDTGHPRHARIGLVDLPPGTDPVRVAAVLGASPLVAFAEPNWTRIQHDTKQPDDPRFGEQYALHNTGGTTATGRLAVAGADLDMLRAWAIETGNRDVIIAVIDTAIDIDHTDLSANMIPGRCFGDCGDDQGDVKSGSSNNSHGTLVAGAAGAVGDNATGIAGAAWRVSIMPLKTDLSISSIVQAIDHAIDNGAHVINGSYGGARFSQLEFEAIQRAMDNDILFVTSAGNFDSDNDKGRLSFPQTYGLPNIIAVAATDASDLLTRWSQYGQTSTRLAAPGEDILSTRPGNGYQFVSGTSVASPLVAGVAALVRARYDGIALHELIARMVAGADMPPALRGRVQAGRANAFNSLQDDLLDDNVVLVIDGIEVDDTALGNANGMLDAGETADLVVRVASLWGDTAFVSATLSKVDPADAQFIEILDDGAVSTAITGPPDAGAADLAFQVRVPDGLLGNHRVRFRLDMEDDAGRTLTRWFVHELGLIEPGSSLDQLIWRDQQDEFHAFHIDVPPGAFDLRIMTETRNEIDIDLLASFDDPPRYKINLGTDPMGSSAFFEVGDGTLVSGRFDGNELIDIADPDPGTWHIVVVNFDRTQHTYRVGVSWCMPSGCMSRVRFIAATFLISGDRPTADVVVSRQGTQGPASVDVSTVGGSAVPGSDYTAVSGTLTWANGETGTRTFSIPLNPGRSTSGSRTIEVRLDNASGAVLAVPSIQAIVTVEPPVVLEPEPRRSGRGVLDPVLLIFLLLIALAATRRRTRRNEA